MGRRAQTWSACRRGGERRRRRRRAVAVAVGRRGRRKANERRTMAFIGCAMHAEDKKTTARSRDGARCQPAASSRATRRLAAPTVRVRGSVERRSLRRRFLLPIEATALCPPAAFVSIGVRLRPIPFPDAVATVAASRRRRARRKNSFPPLREREFHQLATAIAPCNQPFPFTERALHPPTALPVQPRRRSEAFLDRARTCVARQQF